MAASIVATLMARRMVYRNDLNHEHDRQLQLRKHAPMLAALVFPLLMISFAAVGTITLPVAVNVSIASALLLMVSWSILSAPALKTTGIPMFVLICAELGIGLAIVSLKVVLGH